MAILSAKNGRIADGDSRVHLKGVNFGGWLMPEGYIMHAPNRSAAHFRRGFIKACGAGALRELETAFRGSFITEKDFQRAARFGFNSVRLPFHCNLIEESPYVYSCEGVAYLDRAIHWASRHKMRVILDMHAVPGAQNPDWHADSDGRVKFWTTPAFQARALALWEFLADRYKDQEAVAGYDVVNEPVTEDFAAVNRYYHAAVKALRSSDKKHIIFIEGNRWAQDIACLDGFKDDNLALSFHFYEPLEFTFNLIPQLQYPMPGKSQRWDKARMRRRIRVHMDAVKRSGRALWCGEFGVNGRDGVYGEDAWLKDMLAEFNGHGIHWAYWTWKSVKNAMFPDGIYSYLPNAPWVHRQGPLSGWETWPLHWKDNKKAMTDSWRTEAFTENKTVVEVLRKAL